VILGIPGYGISCYSAAAAENAGVVNVRANDVIEWSVAASPQAPDLIISAEVP
jgi:hypothetical protein